MGSLINMNIRLCFIFLSSEFGYSDDDLRCFLHTFYRNILVFPVEVVPSGKDIRTRQPHVRKLRTVCPPSDRLDDWGDPQLLHRLLRNLYDMEYRLYLFSHIVVLVFNLSSDDIPAKFLCIFLVDFLYDFLN